MPVGKAPIPVPRSTLTLDRKLQHTGDVTGTDLSLSTLICSVERDILLLEQMERTGSTLGHLPSLSDSSTSPSLLSSSELLSLPGYRPRPTAPSSPSVVNPGYDALLCRRLYPALSSPPPPPLPAKLGHRRRNSDSMMSTSLCSSPLRSCSPPAHPSTPDSPGETDMAERLSRHALSGPRMVFCPFCVGQFYQQQELQDHLIQAHSQELHLLRDQEFQHFQPETCPCCNAQFLQPGLGPRHLVHHHPDYVVSILLGSLPPPSGRPPPAPPGIVPSTPPPDRHAFCLLCGQRFLRKHVKLLALHLQQQHPAQFSAAVQHHCSMAAVPPDPLTPEGRYLTPSLPLSQEMSLSPPHHYEEVDTTTEQDQYLTILSPVAQTTHAPQDTKRLRMERGEVTECKGIFRKVNTLNTPHKTQQYRSFRRAGPRVIGETYQGIAQPEPPPNPITGLGSESCLLETETEDVETLKLREKENYHHYTSAHLLFRCNLCGDRFDANPDLLSHLKQEHMAVSRVLKPQYSCAKCPANFFKNAFLLKHSLIHTQSQPSV